jgi:surface polysaccharide O-acyltransferase-like enzyme
MAYENNWLEKLTAKQTVLWFRIALAAIVAFPIAQLMAGALEGDHASGGLHIQAVIYAFWEPFVAFGISMFLLAWFRDRFNKTGPVLSRLGESTYTVYIIHAPVLVIIMLSLRNLALFPILKFLLVGSLGTVACFVLARLILKIPYARRIL